MAPQKGAGPAWVPKECGHVPLRLQPRGFAQFVSLYSVLQSCSVQSQYHRSGIWPQESHHLNILLVDITDLTAHQTTSARPAANSSCCPGLFLPYRLRIFMGTVFEAEIISGRNNSSSKQETGHSKRWGEKGKTKTKQMPTQKKEATSILALQGLQVPAHGATTRVQSTEPHVSQTNSSSPKTIKAVKAHSAEDTIQVKVSTDFIVFP